MPVEFFNIDPSELSPQLEAAIDSEVSDVMAAYQEAQEAAPRGWACIEGGLEVSQ